MSDSENSFPQDNSDEDIYKDFDEFNFENELAKLEGSKEIYKQEAQVLDEKVQKLTIENEDLKKANEVLKKNLSTLLKTAQAEVQRKDLVISELRAQVESSTFRTNWKKTKDKYTTTEDLASTGNEKKRSRSGSGDPEHKLTAEEKKKEESFICDNRSLDFPARESSRWRFSEGSTDFRTSKDRGRVTDRQYFRSRRMSRVTSKLSFRQNHREHLMYDSLDKKKYSDERVFPSRRKNSRDRRSPWRESPERKKKRTERVRKDRSRERSPKRSPRTKEVHIKESKHSLEDELYERRDEHNRNRSRDVELESDEKWEGSLEKNRRESKERVRTKKSEKEKEVESFETKSPLDALYGDPQSTLNFALHPAGFTHTEEKDPVGNDVIPFEEDWAMSFINERPNASKPMTLYSRRMLQKLLRKTEKSSSAEENIEKETRKTKREEEKEPGELTDDENVVESSEEFQKLAKVASIESEVLEKIEKAEEDERTFKEPAKRDGGGKRKVSQQPESEAEPPEEPQSMEGLKQIGDFIEFSPFKNRYKLIEISSLREKGSGREATSTHELRSQKIAEPTILKLLSGLVPEKKRESKPSERKEESRKIFSEKEEKKVENDCPEPTEKHSSEEIAPKKKEKKLEKIAGTKSETKEEKKSKNEEIKIDKKEGKKCHKSEENKIEKREMKEEKVIGIEKEKKIDKRVEKEKEVKRVDNKEEKAEHPSEKVELAEEKTENKGEKKPEENVKESKKKSEEKKTEAKKITESESRKSKPRSLPKKENYKPRETKRKKRDSEREEVERTEKVEETPKKKTRSSKESKSEPETRQEEPEVKEDISSFEFFKPITEGKERPKDVPDFPGGTRTVAAVLQTPHKPPGRPRPGERPPSSPAGPKTPGWTPQRILRNDLMLTDSEDESVAPRPLRGEASEASEEASDSGASDLVDLL